MKIAGAPISWGVCEVPGWGPMLPADRVLRELTSLGMNAIELGSPGFLPDTPEAVKAKLDEHGVVIDWRLRAPRASRSRRTSRHSRFSP